MFWDQSFLTILYFSDVKFLELNKCDKETIFRWKIDLLYVCVAMVIIYCILRNEIVPDKSSHILNSFKVKVNLKKMDEGLRWGALEPGRTGGKHVI